MHQPVEHHEGEVEKIIEETKPKVIPEPMTCMEKFRYFRSNITVEPMLASYIIACVVASLATQNLNLEKACRVNLRYSDEICDELSSRNTANYTKEESEVQQLVVNMTIWKTVIQSALPAALLLFVGSWSDRWGRRKPCMMSPLYGEFMCSIGLIVLTFYFYELPMEVAGLVESVLPAISGGWYTMFMAVFSYIGDVSTVETRTLRIGLVNICISVGVPIGMAFSGILYMKLGFYGTFIISSIIFVISILYGWFGIKEEPKPNLPERPVGCCAHLRDFFDLKHVKESFAVCFKEGPKNRKKRVIMLMVVVMVIIGPTHGEYVMIYLFVRYRFNWNEVDFSMFSTYSLLTSLLGTTFSISVFSHYLKYDDAIIGVLSCISKILACLIYAFATETWMICIAPLIEILSGTSAIAMRSIISKLVPSDELGKVNSVFGVCESLVPFVYGPLYSWFYGATMHTLPGAMFLLSAVLYLPAVFIFLWMYTEHMEDKKKDQLSKLEKEVLNGDVVELKNLDKVNNMV